MLVSFEGIDGSGKSTQAQRLVERLRAAGREAVLLREPGGTELSERVRTLLLDPGLHIEPFAEMLLFSAARAQLVRERVRPLLASRAVVVLDRFYDSTTAYQGAGRGLGDVAWLRDFNHRVTGGLAPARTYLVELSAEEALARRRGREASGAGAEDRMEAAGLAFQQRVAAAYAELAEAEPERIVRLDGRKSVEALHEEVWGDLRRVMSDE